MLPWLIVLLVSAASGFSLFAPDRGSTGSSKAVDHLPPMEVFFSPKGGCTDAIVREIDQARGTILVQAYSFTSAPIAKALVDARQRGVEVAVVLDKSQESEKYSSADFVLHAGIPTRIDGHHAIAHNKIIILDGQTVVTGSFNFTKAAEESNAENLLIIRDAAIADVYTQNWQSHAEHSEPYVGKNVESEDGRSGSTKSAPAKTSPNRRAKTGAQR
jgi:phosphatidylserine/phosphatidylglycerophosphate/cardiolipin synthase-like enzyme